MAQFLKPEIRERIIKAATEEFLRHGCENASMRKVRWSAGMTVGNLYRYFKNKEELIYRVVAPAYDAINQLAEDLTAHTVSLKSDGGNAPVLPSKILQVMDELSEGLVEIYASHKDRLNILMMTSDINRRLKKWFSKFVERFIEDNFSDIIGKEILTLVSLGYSAAIFSGLQEILKSANDEDDLESAVKIYFRAYADILKEKCDNKKEEIL